MLFYNVKKENDYFSPDELTGFLETALGKLGTKKRVLIIPPDITRIHSFAGNITRSVFNFYRDSVKAILPALGTHRPMSTEQIDLMFGNIPLNLFQHHDWRNDIETLGTVPSDYLSEVSSGRLNFTWPAQVNRLITSGQFDLILSIGQVVPHEVVGMAGYNKNIFIGTGGAEAINKSHFLSAVTGIENILGRIDTPVRRVLNYASVNFAADLPVLYILTVNGENQEGSNVLKGIFMGDNHDCFNMAAGLSAALNIKMLDKPIKKAVVYLDPVEYKSTWLGNKSIYRTRLAMADGGELLILAPGLKEFGEDKALDRLIRTYGYRPYNEMLRITESSPELQDNLSASAHLMQGSSEGRFIVTYCPGHLTGKEIRSVNYNYIDIRDAMKAYNPGKLKEGVNILPGGEEIYYISNPAKGLWAWRSRFSTI